MAGRIKLAKVNTDTAQNLASRFGIRGIPTLVLLDHGNELARVTGALGEPALRKWVEENIATRSASRN